MHVEDHLAPSNDYAQPTVFDPDKVLTQAMLDQLAAATSTTSQTLCQPFIRADTIVTDNKPTSFTRGLLDTGAQGSNFISRQLFNSLPPTVTNLSRPIDRIFRVGDARFLSIQLEVPLTTSVFDSSNNNHQHMLWYSVLHDLSHDIIIGLIDIIGPFYDLYADSIVTARQLLITNELGTNLTRVTQAINQLRLKQNHHEIESVTRKLRQCNEDYVQRKNVVCDSATTNIHPIALEDGTVADVLAYPRLGHAFADNRVETQYDKLTALLCSPDPGDLLQPWSKPIDSLAPCTRRTQYS